MICRLWVCTEQPWIVSLLSLPLRPLFLLFVLALACWWMLIRRARLARLALRGAAAAGVLLVACTALFLGLAAGLRAAGHARRSRCLSVVGES
jgi:hypothetical protein